MTFISRITISIFTVIMCLSDNSIAFARPPHYWLIGTIDKSRARAHIVIDSNSLFKYGGAIRIWKTIVFDYGDENFMVGGRYLISEYELRCNSRQSKLIQAVEYFSDGHQSSDNKMQSWMDIIPGSVDESVLEFSCSNQALRPHLGSDLSGATLEMLLAASAIPPK